MIERDKKGRFIKGHGWDSNVLDKMSKTKRASSPYTEKTSVCECCKITFVFIPNSHHLIRRFCSMGCVRKLGGRSGIPLSKESRVKMSKTMTGSSNPMWRGGSSKRRAKAMDSLRYTEWREKVFKRDNHTCQICKQRGGKLNADHIIPWSVSKKSRYLIKNGRTLCIKCHKEVTIEWLKTNWKNQYGRNNTTRRPTG